MTGTRALLLSTLLFTACLDGPDDESLVDDLAQDDEAIVGAGVEILTGAQAASAGLVGLVVSDAPGVRTGYCSGVLVGARTVLTAGHCLSNPKGALKYAVFPGSAGAFDIFAPGRTLVAIDATKRASGVDLALVRLAAPAPASHAHMKVAARRKLGLYGATIAAYGFGRRVASDPASGGPPQRLTAKVGSLEPYVPIFYVNSPSKSGLCFGDSGGPAVLATASGPVVVGVLSSGNPDCNGGDLYAATGAGESWLRSASAALGDAITLVVP